MPDPSRLRWTRRGFLATTISSVLAACSRDGGSDSDGPPSTAAATTTSSTSSTSTTSPPTSAPPTTVTIAETTVENSTTSSAVPGVVESNPFTLGVASGDPLDTAVVIWTRLAPVDGGLPAEDILVGWEVATDPDMGDVVAHGTAIAFAALAHSVHVDVTGLRPDGEYHYRFSHGEYTTEPARTRTFAAPGTTPDVFRFAFASCQNYEHGEYAAYRDVAARGRDSGLDAFVFLGDYIYEYRSGAYADSRGRLTGQDFECVTLDQYRARYAVYRSDRHLQAAHAAVPWIITWDDHEVDNDYAGSISEDDAPVAEFDARRAAAYQAWYEHMPVRLEPPTGPDYAIYRSFAHGDLVRFHVLDTRQYRSDQQRGPAFVPQVGQALQVRDSGLASSLEQSILGAEQREWLFDGAAASTAVWDVLAQQVFMFGATAVPGAPEPVVVVDTWDGYAAERAEVLGRLDATVDNLVVLTGDFHSAAVADLRVDPFDRSQPVVGSELMATSISSWFFDNDAIVGSLVSLALTTNPHIKWIDTRRGYTWCEVTPDRWTATYRVVVDQFDAESPVEDATVWEVVAGSPGPVPGV